MLKGIFAAAIVVLALMVVVKDGRVLRATGLFASCRVVQSTPGGARVEACRPGRLQGTQDPSGTGCAAIGSAGPVDYWRCPAR